MRRCQSDSLPAMSRTKSQPKNVSITGCLVPALLLVLTVLALSWNAQLPPLTTDAEMIEQWQSSKSQWLELVKACDQSETSYDLAEQYEQANKLISLSSIDDFSGCEVQTDPSQPSDNFRYIAQNRNTFLLLADQRRKGTGWIEEKASQWSGGWISWKSAILEEKGFIYTVQGPIEDTISPLPTSAEITTESLDQFVGRYRGTSQISGNSSCEIWKLRPIGSQVDDDLNQSTWYLFYHQARECPS